MSSLFSRQMNILLEQLAGYRGGFVSLDALIDRIEGVSNVLENESWKEKVFPMVVLMEQINAVVIDEGRVLSDQEREVIADVLSELENLIKSYQ